jgi:hypothetical protein
MNPGSANAPRSRLATDIANGRLDCAQSALGLYQRIKHVNPLRLG